MGWEIKLEGNPLLPSRIGDLGSVKAHYYRPITAAIKVTSCKKMGGATFYACQSETLSVSKRLISSI